MAATVAITAPAANVLCPAANLLCRNALPGDLVPSGAGWDRHIFMALLFFETYRRELRYLHEVKDVTRPVRNGLGVFVHDIACFVMKITALFSESFRFSCLRERGSLDGDEVIVDDVHDQAPADTQPVVSAWWNASGGYAGGRAGEVLRSGKLRHGLRLLRQVRLDRRRLAPRPGARRCRP
jgi:hypothetical protein